MKLLINLYLLTFATQSVSVSGQAATCGDIYCKDGVTNHDFDSFGQGFSCSKVKEDLALVSTDDPECTISLRTEVLCCPGVESCAYEFCPDGVENDDEICQGEDGLCYDCHDYKAYSLGLIPAGSEDCEYLSTGQAFCCPSQAHTNVTCATAFCPDYIDGDKYLPEVAFTCSDYRNLALPFVPVDSEDCLNVMQKLSFQCCPREPECFLCGGKDVQMNNPAGFLFLHEFTCEEIDETVQLYPAQTCGVIKEQYGDIGVDLQSFCGCEGYEAPEVCGPICDAHQSINKDGFIVMEDDDDFDDEGSSSDSRDNYDIVDDNYDYYEAPITCKEWNELATHVTDKDICTNDIQTAANKEACCIDGKSKSKGSKSKKSYTKTSKSGKSSKAPKSKKSDGSNKASKSNKGSKGRSANRKLLRVKKALVDTTPSLAKLPRAVENSISL